MLTANLKGVYGGRECSPWASSPPVQRSRLLPRTHLFSLSPKSNRKGDLNK